MGAGLFLCLLFFIFSLNEVEGMVCLGHYPISQRNQIQSLPCDTAGLHPGQAWSRGATAPQDFSKASQPQAGETLLYSPT